MNWKILTEMFNVLKHPFELTMEIQRSTYTLSDFFGGWMHMVRKLTPMAQEDESPNNFARLLLKEINKREPSLLNNGAMLAAVYLDPRYRFKLSPQDIKIAKLTLEDLLKRTRRVKHLLSQSQSEEVDQVNDSFEEECVRSGLARTSFGCNLIPPPVVDNNEGNVDMFTAYDQSTRIHHKNSILEYWKDNGERYPVLNELASIIHSIPPSQTTVERAFSVLGYIYNSRRTRLSPQILEDILMLILNRNIVETIHKRDLEALR